MKKEHSLILKAVLQNKSEKEIREIDKILDSNLDWIEIAGIALNHRLGGYIYKGLNTSQQKKMPKEVVKALELLVRAQKEQFEENLEEICKVNDALEEAKIKFAVLKGAFFGCEMYEKGTRRSNDIDLLVYEDDLGKLDTCLRAMGYIQSNINRIKELADLLYAEWSDYVTVSVSKIKRKRFDSPEAVTESIEKMEDEIVSITKGYIDFLEKDEGTDRENKKISNEIIFVEEGKIIFSITDGKTHNFWFEDKAPKYPLLKNCNDDKIFAKARILFNQESEENLYQAGIYVKSAEDKVYYMAIDNDRNCILDTIGENNRKGCKRQTMRQSLKSTPPIIGDVASCIRPEDYLTMA